MKNILFIVTSANKMSGSKTGVWFEELATPYAFARDPKLLWEWYDWRRQIISRCSPNPGHYAVKEFEDNHFMNGFEPELNVFVNVQSLKSSFALNVFSKCMDLM